MKLSEALKILRRPTPQGKPFRVSLSCGFTPIHLQTFLGAHLREHLPERPVDVSSGLYGDLFGNLNRIEQDRPDAAVLVFEWVDLDPRLGFRQLGGWGPQVLGDIAETVEQRLSDLMAQLARLPDSLAIAVSGPTLPLPPVSHYPGWRCGAFEFRLDLLLSSVRHRLTARPNLRLLSSDRLDLLSHPSERLDLKSDEMSGIPHHQTHTAVLGDLLARLVVDRPPKKGLITDLDDTLWRGILGEKGPDRVSWNLEDHALGHGLYQQSLAALADAGVLIGVASKNNADLVEQVFRRSDIVLATERIFPFEVHWQAKSQSVARILELWNVGADSVVFVDDSPMELEEVKAHHPDIECLRFEQEDRSAVLELIHRLRDLFGKSEIMDEDALRLDSLRRTALVFANADERGEASDAFLKSTNAAITFRLSDRPVDSRALELVNKTNQFNLNGVRYTEAEWANLFDDGDGRLLVAEYEDKFGLLGMISALAGRTVEDRFRVDVWVLSCRAFARRIEYRCLAHLFEKLDVSELHLSFRSTERNQPFREFLDGLVPAQNDADRLLSKAEFERLCPALFHQVREK